MASYRFEAVLERPDEPGSWTYLVVPLNVEAAFGSKGNVKIRGMVNGHPYQGTLMPLGGGKHMMVVKKEIRDQINAEKGDTVQVVIEADHQERTVSIPEDLQIALNDHTVAKVNFEKFSYSRRKEYVVWVESAKAEATRQRRIVKAVERIAQGLPLKE